MMKKAMAGFTLAEVLTTLMVIGVVAAMTIPTLMNGTADQQARVAYRKAMSVLGQGIQLMIAREEECQVTNSHELAVCMSNVISGSLYTSGSGNGDSAKATLDADNGNVIVTADGMAYAFYYTPDGSTSDDASRTLDSICGSSMASTEAGYAGKGSNCMVIVDTNGINKGTKFFYNTGSNKSKADWLKSGGSGLTDAMIVGDEQAALTLSGAGVRPTWVRDNSKASRGYQYMYGAGKDAAVSPFST